MLLYTVKNKFDVAEIKSPLQGHGERRDEVLYLIPRRRFVLVYAFDRYEDFDGTEDSIKPPPPWLDRELSHEDASLWLRLNRHKERAGNNFPISH